MKFRFVLCALFLVVYACEKEPNVPIDNNISDQEIGDTDNPFFFIAATKTGDSLIVDCDHNIPLDSLSATIVSYISTNYPGFEIDEAETCIDDLGNPFYKVEIESESPKEKLELLFDETGTFISSDVKEDKGNNGVHISEDALPSNLLDYLAANYEGIGIKHSKRKHGGYEIMLDNNVKLIFDVDGDFVSVKNDDDDDGTDNDGEGGENNSVNIDISELPAIVTDYINANYPDIGIKKAQQKRDGHYEVMLNNNIKLVFDADGNFVEEKGG